MSGDDPRYHPGDPMKRGPKKSSPFTRGDVEQLRAMAAQARKVSMDAALTLSDDLVGSLKEAERLIETQDDLEYDSDFLSNLANRIEERLPLAEEA